MFLLYPEEEIKAMPFKIFQSINFPIIGASLFQGILHVLITEVNRFSSRGLINSVFCIVSNHQLSILIDNQFL